MNLTFRCKHIKLGDGLYAKEPIVLVTLKGPTNQSINTTAILDSGSDFVLLPLEVAETLELPLDLKDEQKAKGYEGNHFSTTQSKVFIQVSKDRERKSFECKCAVLTNPNQQHEHIIFGSNFFEKFKIIFDYPHNKFQIKG